jgi:hypothetical protein
MHESGEDYLLKERQNLVRALHDIECEEATGLIEGDREAIKDLLIFRIAKIDQALSEKAN